MVTRQNTALNDYSTEHLSKKLLNRTQHWMVNRQNKPL